MQPADLWSVGPKHGASGRKAEWGLRVECVVLDRRHEAVSVVYDSSGGEKTRRGGDRQRCRTMGRSSLGG